jgi:hypothetical protein
VIKIHEIHPSLSESICRLVTNTLPEWFGQANANERYAKGVSERISFAAFDHDVPIGLITLEFQHPESNRSSNPIYPFNF